MHYYYDADNIESAISELETAITIDPAYKTAYRLAGFLYQQLGNNEVAIKYLSKAIELDSSEVDAILYRANSYRNMGNLTKALADYSVALQKSPERQDLWIARGALYADTLKDYSKALFDFYRAYQIDTTDINTAFNLALTYYKSGSYDSSVWFSDKALRTGNKSANFIKSLSLNKLKRFKESHDAAVQAEKDGIVVPDSLMQK
jgi:tetratricopeptide (TPR) repeat protein